MKALIIYQDFASAVKANGALQRTTLRADLHVQWNIRPWQLDLLKFPPTAEEVLADAVDAHLLLFSGCCVQWIPFWLQSWLENWAKRRQTVDAALAVVREENADMHSMAFMPELARFARRHSLSFIGGESEAIGNESMRRGVILPAGNSAIGYRPGVMEPEG